MEAEERGKDDSAAAEQKEPVVMKGGGKEWDFQTLVNPLPAPGFPGEFQKRDQCLERWQENVTNVVWTALK